MGGRQHFGQHPGQSSFPTMTAWSRRTSEDETIAERGSEGRKRGENRTHNAAFGPPRFGFGPPQTCLQANLFCLLFNWGGGRVRRGRDSGCTPNHFLGLPSARSERLPFITRTPVSNRRLSAGLALGKHGEIVAWGGDTQSCFLPPLQRGDLQQCSPFQEKRKSPPLPFGSSKWTSLGTGGRRWVFFGS